MPRNHLRFVPPPSPHHAIADVAIVGAGPYGLSLAAHLAHLGSRLRVFGRPMDSWLRHMPRGMLLKSDGFASNLSDPGDAFTLEAFCRREGRPYAHRGESPVTVETFCDYGLAFQMRYVPCIDKLDVVSVAKTGDSFSLTLSDGRVVGAAQVVIAVGVGAFAQVPETLSALPADRVSHSFDHSDLSRFAGKRVAIVGGGASAIDTATLLAEAGAETTLVARREKLNFSGVADGSRPTFWQRLRNPPSGLGPGWRSRLATDVPLLIRLAPGALRRRFVRRHLGPGASGWMLDRFNAKVHTRLGCDVTSAAMSNEGVELTLHDRVARREILNVDHVIAATGFKVDVQRASLLSPELRAAIDVQQGWPTLSSRFETSVPGLYMIGPAAAGSFGPMLRFAYGARFVARRLARKFTRFERLSIAERYELAMSPEAMQ